MPPEKSARQMPPLHWFVDDDNRPLALELRGAKVFCFFGSRLNAEAFKRTTLEAPGGWILVGNGSADYLIGLCERAGREGYTAFALDPPPNPPRDHHGGWFPTWTLEEFKGVIERAAAAEQEGGRR